MKTTNIVIKDRTITIQNKIKLIGIVGQDKFKIEFQDAEWAGLHKTLKIIRGDKQILKYALYNDEVTLTQEFYIKGIALIGFYGTINEDDPEEMKIASTDYVSINVCEHAYDNEDGIAINEPTPSQWDIIIGQMNDVVDEMNDIKDDTLQYKNDTAQLKADTQQIKNDTAQLKADTIQIKADTEQVKNDTQALKAGVEQDVQDFNTDYTAKIGVMNEKYNEFNANAQTKTNQYNQNATEKTNAFNANASDKTNAFNSNYNEKLNAINSAGSTQVSAVNSAGSTQVGNVETAGTTQVGLVNTAGTTAITNIEDAEDTAVEHIQEQGSSYDTKILELYAQIPQGIVKEKTINVQDTSNLPIKNITIIGNTTQDDTQRTYKCDGTETGDFYFTYDNVNYQFTMPTVVSGDLLVFDTITLKLYHGTTEITTTTGATGTLITLTLTPNPVYPQEIKTVTGDVTAKIIGKQLIPLIPSGNYSVNNYKLDIDNNIMHISIIDEPVSNKYLGAFGIDNIYRYGNYGDYVAWKGQVLKVGTYTLSAKYVSGTTSSATSGGSNIARLIVYGRKIGSTGRMNLSLGQVYLATHDVSTTFTIEEDMEVNIVIYVYGATAIDLFIQAQLEAGTVATAYEPYTEQTQLLSLGSMELCCDKNGNYRDCLFKAIEGDKFYQSLTEEQKATLTLGKLYKYKIIKKNIFDGSENWYKLNGVYTYTNNKVADMLKSTSGSNLVFMCPRYRSYSTRYRVTLPNLGICKTIPDAINQQVGVRDDAYETVNDFKAMLALNNLPCYYILETPVFEEITDATLIAQLDALYNMHTYKNVTNILTQTSNETPILDVIYYKDLETLFNNLTNAIVSLGNNI